jgi:hypothetical protein
MRLAQVRGYIDVDNSGGVISFELGQGTSPLWGLGQRPEVLIYPPAEQEMG